MEANWLAPLTETGATNEQVRYIAGKSGQKSCPESWTVIKK
jgi:hypothetical protein